VSYNAVIDFKVVTDLSAEPVTLVEVKQHLNMQFDTEGSYEFTDDDTKLTSLMKSCRKRLEKYTGVSFGPKTVRAILNNGKGNIELPYGPTVAITAIIDEDGDTIEADDYTLQGIEFKTLKSPCSCYVDVTYTAGFTTLPEDLKMALLEEIAFRYENRGTTENKLCDSALLLAEPHSRNVWLL